MGTKITVTSRPKNRVQINTRMGAGGGSAIDTIAELRDVDAADADNNETLVYDSTTQKYVVKTLPTIDGGSY
jgi:hypothetical protein